MEDNKEEITLFDDSGNEDQKQQTDKDELIFSGDVESLLKKEKKPTQSKNIKFSVKFKFSLLTAIIIVILTLAISFYLLNIIKTNLTMEMQIRAKLFTENLSRNLSEVYEDDATRHEIILKNKESLPDIENIFIINTKNELVDVGDNTVFQKILVSKFDDSVEKLFKTLDPSIKETLEKDNLYQRDYFENKEEKIVYYSKIKIGKITLGYLEIDFTMKYINQKIKDVQFRIIMFIMVFLLVGIIISYVLTSKIIRPIKTLSEGVQIIGNGDLHHHIHIKSNDELENLATEFNHMTDKLLRAQKSLVEKERLDEQLEIARTIQENLLPEKIPVLPEVEISTFYKAAKGVGGDYYDLIHLKEEGKIGTLIADVSGKGVPAALIMVMIRTIFHTSFNYLKSTDNVIQNINQGLTRRLTGEKFVTMFFFIYNVKTGELEFSNAAHSALLVYKKNKNEIIELDAEGVPLGLETSAHYHARTTSLDPGDIIITYTDGITEAMNNKNELFRLRRLKEIIMQNTTLSAGSLKDKIISEINNFTGDAPQHDDMTLVIYTIKKIEGKPLTHQNTPINQIKNSIINPLDPYSILI